MDAFGFFSQYALAQDSVWAPDTLIDQQTIYIDQKEGGADL